MSERAPSLIAVAGRRAPSTRRSRRPAAVTAHVNRSLRATTSAPTSSRPRPTGPPVVRATRCPSCARVRGTTRLGPAPPRATASAAGSPPAEPRISRPPRRPVVDRGGDKFMRAQFHGGTNGTLGLGLTLAMFTDSTRPRWLFLRLFLNTVRRRTLQAGTAEHGG